MQRSGTLYTLGFAAAVCLVCSALVCGAAVALKSRQELNVVIDRQEKILSVSGLVALDEAVAAAELQRRFDDNIVMRVVDLATGEYAPNEDELLAAEYDMVEGAKDEETSVQAPANRARVKRLPKYAVVPQVINDGKPDMLILPVWGQGLWSVLYGYIALDKDCTTVRGLTFYEHEETPGLGGEVDNPNWKALWPGRKVFDNDGKPAIRLVKGRAGSVEEAPHAVDALSGATITSRGVENLLNFWLSEHGYGPYLERFRETGS
ncbi:MAG: Na(+)-translocating NADH-quinone reductase subunit C [Candidatus Hydrogenedentes bacterium]|nr:Na(+)-translocating NADH-quinone reductase subunit C [Candidatus Hydrogenedentota bacterium]